MERAERNPDSVHRQEQSEKLWEQIEQITGLPYQTVVDFFAVGMLMNVAAAMNLPEVDARWTSWCPKPKQ